MSNDYLANCTIRNLSWKLHNRKLLSCKFEDTILLSYKLDGSKLLSCNLHNSKLLSCKLHDRKQKFFKSHDRKFLSYKLPDNILLSSKLDKRICFLANLSTWNFCIKVINGSFMIHIGETFFQFYGFLRNIIEKVKTFAKYFKKRKKIIAHKEQP